MEILRYNKLEYVERLPEKFEEGVKYPLVFYIHGAGGRGKDINKIFDHCFFSDTAPFLTECISSAPQCYADS